MGDMIDGVLLTPLRIIPTLGGDVWHGMKRTDPGYVGFGEAYFSTIDYGAIKPWKLHLRMIMNLVVPVGEIRFVLKDERPHSSSSGQVQEVCLSRDQSYQRLTVPPGIWMAFQGLFFPMSILLNIADQIHDRDEVKRLSLDAFPYDWESRS